MLTPQSPLGRLVMGRLGNPFDWNGGTPGCFTSHKLSGGVVGIRGFPLAPRRWGRMLVHRMPLPPFVALLRGSGRRIPPRRPVPRCR